MAICWADGLWVSLSYLTRRKVILTYLYIAFQRLCGIERMRSELRKPGASHMNENSHLPYSTWDLRSFRVWQINVFINFSVKMFIILWHHLKKNYSSSNQMCWLVIQPLVEIAFDKSVSIVILFLILWFHEIIPKDTMLSPFVCTWVRFSFKQPKTSWLEQWRKMAGHCQMLLCSGSGVPTVAFLLLTLRAPNMPLEQLLPLQH